MNFAVCGFGLIGKERVKALMELKQEGCPVGAIFVYDPYYPEKNRKPLRGVTWLDSTQDILARHPDWAILAVPHDTAPALVRELLPANPRMLMEKPFCRNLSEAKKLAKSIPDPKRFWVGFNYRFYPAVARLLRDFRNGWFGKIISINMCLGQGGAPGMEKSWKLDPQRGGEGCLLDPGIHLLDLVFLLSQGDIKPVKGLTWKGFWNTGITEECSYLMKGKGFTIQLEASLLRWRNTFKIEVHGQDGYGLVNGRGGHYGPQTYIRGKRWGWQKAASQAASEEELVRVGRPESFKDELRALIHARSKSYPAPCSLKEAMEVMTLYDRCLKFGEWV